MKKNFIQLILFLFVAGAFAQSDIPAELQFEYVYGTAQSTDGEWLFVNGVSAADKKNRLYSFNKRTKESHILFEPIGNYKMHFVSGMYFWGKTQKLYFQAHGGGIFVNDVGDLFLQNGIYSCENSDGGGYKYSGVKRHSGLADWLMKNLWNSYIAVPLKKNTQPDYDAFLLALYSYADTNSNPIFGVQKANGEFIYGKDALRFVVENIGDDFIKEKKYNYCFPLEKYLFACDEEGNPTNKSAYTLLERNPLFAKTQGKVFSETYFVEANDSLYFLDQKGSFKDNGNASNWSNDYSVIYELHDAERGFYVSIPDELKNIRTLPCTFDDGGNAVPIESVKDGLFIRDADGKTKWLYSKDGVKEIFVEATSKAVGGRKHEVERSFVFVVLPFVFFVLFLVAAVCVLRVLQRKFIYKIQENEKEKIARDIHDSVVQDIRAIRLGAEMLKVEEASAAKKDELIEKITACIIKMRNICYGLTPAEFVLSESNAEKIDLLSILNALCSQFTVRSNIPCHLNCEAGIQSVLLEREKCENIVRIVQEAFRNIEKHSYATESQVLVRQENPEGKNTLTIFIIDDGRGCDIKEAVRSRLHFGLRSIKERAKIIGAKVSFRSTPGDGMQIKLMVNSEGNG